MEQFALFYCGSEAPIVLHRMGNASSVFRSLRTRTRNFVNNFFGSGILDRKRFARKTGHELAVDEHLAHCLFVFRHLWDTEITRRFLPLKTLQIFPTPRRSNLV